MIEPSEHHQDHDGQPHTALAIVTVTYVAAPKPFDQEDVARSESLGTVKHEALQFFHLTEGTSPDGTATTYTLYHDKKPLENLNETLGDVAGHADALHLKLVQEIKQG